MRITQRAVALTSLQGLNRNLAAVGRLQQQLTSGKLLSVPSDSPTDTNKAMQTRDALRANDQYARNTADGKAWLNITDSTLQTMLDMTRQVRDLTVQGMNEGTMSPASRQAIATQVRALRDGLIGQANTTVNNRPIFGGVTAGTTAYTATGTWTGDGSAPVARRVSATETVRIDITGTEAFGAPGSDLFAVVDQIATDVSANPSALASHLNDLDTALNRMLTSVADVGSRTQRIDRADQTVTDRALALRTTLSTVEDIDLPKTIMDLEMQKTGYQAALSATAKAIQPTLMDFLR